MQDAVGRELLLQAELPASNRQHNHDGRGQGYRTVCVRDDAKRKMRLKACSDLCLTLTQTIDSVHHAKQRLLSPSSTKSLGWTAVLLCIRFLSIGSDYGVQLSICPYGDVGFRVLIPTACRLRESGVPVPWSKSVFGNISRF